MPDTTIKALSKAEAEAALSLVWRVFLEYEAPENTSPCFLYHRKGIGKQLLQSVQAEKMTVNTSFPKPKTYSDTN